MRRIKIEPHDSLEEMEARYRGASDGVERSQWQIIWLLASGKTSAEVADSTGYCVDWIRKLAARYNKQGAAGLGDGRHHNPGRALSLSSYDQKRLKQLLKEAADRGERWSSARVAAWMSERLGRRVYAQRGWEMLRRLGFRPKVGRPGHAKADKVDQTIHKKTLHSL